jgi:hypothetical protein
MSKQQWSDDESSDYEEDGNIMQQPNRDFPPSESEGDNDNEDGEDDYDMEYIRTKTASTESMSWSNALMKDVPKPQIVKPTVVVVSKNIKQEQAKYKKREFNPRLPPPEKYNKFKNNTKDFKLNHTDFPTL